MLAVNKWIDDLMAGILGVVRELARSELHVICRAKLANMAKAGRKGKMKYITIGRDNYGIAIWDNCSAELQVRVDGLRARIIADVQYYTNNGNTCGIKSKTQYFEGREAVCGIVRSYRHLQHNRLTNADGKYWIRELLEVWC